MIPFNPFSSNAEAYRNSPVKWRSVTYLVNSRRSSTAEVVRKAQHRRSQSTSAIPSLTNPQQKRTGCNEDKRRKSSLSTLIELKRFLPAAVQKSLSSSNSSLTQGESAAKREPLRHQQGAKELIRRIKENCATTSSSFVEGVASHRFEKQAQKNLASPLQLCSAAQLLNAKQELSGLVSGDERSSRPDYKSVPNQRNRPSLPERFIDDEETEITDSTNTAATSSTNPTSSERPVTVKPGCKSHEEAEEKATVESISPSSSSLQEPGVQKGVTSHPTASHRTFITSESTGKEEVVQLVFESRFPSTAFASTGPSAAQPQQELSLKSDKTLQQTVESLIKTLTTFQSISTQPLAASNQSLEVRQHHTESIKKHKRGHKKRRKRRIEAEEGDSQPPEASLYVRRHTLPDMTVATYGMVICGTDDLHHRYRGRIEKVKFGVPISEAFSHDIPATLLVLLLKVNKEGPLKKDIWRAPGNQAQVRKLSHIMQHGRLVNISHISVYTAASVIKKFLSKLPGGIFGSENEQQLFSIMQQPDGEQQRLIFCRAVSSLSIPSQHLLVLLFGTFRIIADNAETFNTRMSADAIGISVAPSLFHTCIHDGQRAKLEDVMRFKLASQVISTIIKAFGCTNLFPRECYEFYARITGRTLHVDDDWNFTFQYPSNSPKPDTTTFSTMLSSISAAMAARSYSLDTLGEESMTAELARASIKPGIQRGGSLKTAEFSVGRRPVPDQYAHHKSRSSNPVMAPTGSLQRNVAEPTSRLGMTNRISRQPLSACTNNPTRFQMKASSASVLPDRKPSVHRQQSSIGLVYAQRVVVSDSPPHGPPPAPPSSQSPQKCRLVDSEMNGTFSQPEIYPSREDKDDDDEDADDQPGPSGLKTGGIRQHHTDPAITEAENSDVEEEDLYSEYLPAYQIASHSARGRASSSGGKRGRKQEINEFADLTEQHRLSSSLGEVMLSHPDDEFEVERRRLCLTTLHGGADSVESTRSLTYLEWVHEKQTRRMRTRSEWFLSPAMPQKNNSNSKSVDFDTTRFTITAAPTRGSPMHLNIPDHEMNLQSSSEEMRTLSSMTSSHSPASSLGQPQASPMPVDSDPEEKKIVPLNLSGTGETTPRLPFQMIQHQSGDDDDAPVVATPPARQQPPVFFAGDNDDLPKLKSQHSSSSSSNQSQSSIIHHSPAASVTPGLNRVSSMGVVRRKSWRTHYVRPNKSLDQETTSKEAKDTTETSQSTPTRYPSSTSIRRASATEAEAPETSRALIRRKSSGSSVKSKIPIQARKSTQI